MAAALQIMQTYLRGKYCTQEVHGRGEEVCTVYRHFWEVYNVHEKYIQAQVSVQTTPIEFNSNFT